MYHFIEGYLIKLYGVRSESSTCLEKYEEKDGGAELIRECPTFYLANLKNALTFTFLLFLVRQKIVVPCFYAFFLLSLLDGERASTSTTLRLDCDWWRHVMIAAVSRNG